MAGVLVTVTKKHIGTAAENAALSKTGVPAGSTYYDQDSGKMEILGSDNALHDKVDLVKLIAGTALAGKVGIDQSTANANEVVTKAGSVTTITGAVTLAHTAATIGVATGAALAAKIKVRGTISIFGSALMRW